VLVEGALGGGWVGEEAVASAMYCFWRSPDDFEGAILTAINTDGDSASIRHTAGGGMGGRLGGAAVPGRWRDGVEESKFRQNLGARLWMKRRTQNNCGITE